MKKRIYYALCSATVLAALALTSCDDDNKTKPDTPSEPEEPEVVDTGIGVFPIQTLLDVAKDVYEAWEDTGDIPTAVAAGDISLTLPQYQYALCKTLTSIASGSTADITVFSYEAADSPDNDSYDKESIAVKGGPANGVQTEDLTNVAERMVKMMQVSGRVPNQTLYMRDGSAIAFGTSRATLAIARALSTYAGSGALDSEVSVGTRRQIGTIAEFATEFVKILDVWQEHVGTIYADSKHAASNPFQEAHYIPTLSSYPDSDNNLEPETTITVGKVTMTMDQAWQVAITGIIDLITVEGSEVVPTAVDVAAHTPGDGKPMSHILYECPKWDRWTYPWYEADETLNLSDKLPVTTGLLVRLLPWWLKRANDFGYVGNFQYLHSFGYGEYSGQICSMRCLLIMARFYKEVLDGGITDKVYTYMQDKVIDHDLYGIIPTKEKQYKTIDLEFYEANSIGAVLYTSTYYFPSNGQASVNATYRNDLKEIEYNFKTDYTFKLWARYGISRSTGSGMILGLRYNPQSSTYGGTDGSGWMMFPVINGFRLTSVTITLYKWAANFRTWSVVSGVTPNSDETVYSIADGARNYGSFALTSDNLTATIELPDSAIDTPYYMISSRTYNGDIRHITLEYETE